jgi:hypothetical protein
VKAVRPPYVRQTLVDLEATTHSPAREKKPMGIEGGIGEAAEQAKKVDDPIEATGSNGHDADSDGGHGGNVMDELTG